MIRPWSPVGIGLGPRLVAAAALVPLAAAAVRWPGPVALALAGGAVALAALVRVEIALLLVLASAPLEGALPPSGPITVTKAAGALCFASFAFGLARGRLRPVRDRGRKLALWLLALALVSTTFVARYQPQALAATIRIASFVGIYLVLSHLAGRGEVLRRLAWALAIACTAAAALGLQTFLSGGRAQATLAYADPNDYGFVLATTLPITLWLATTRRKLLRVAAVGMALAQTSALVFSLSRGSLLGLAAALFFVLLTERRLVVHVLVGGVVLAGVALVIVNANTDRVQEALTQKENIASSNVSSRLQAWRTAGELMAERPVLGVGPGNFGPYYRERSGIPPGTFAVEVVHNTWLDVGATMGIPALALFAGLIAVAFRRLTRARSAGYGPPGLAAALRISLVVGVVSGSFVSEQYFLPFWLIAGMAAALGAEAVLPAGRRAHLPAAVRRLAPAAR